MRESEGLRPIVHRPVGGYPGGPDSNPPLTVLVEEGVQNVVDQYQHVASNDHRACHVHDQNLKTPSPCGQRR